MCPNNEWRLSAIRDGTSRSFVLSLTTALDTLSYHLIPKIRRSACMWKDWILSLSTLRTVHVSEPYNTTDCTREMCIFWCIIHTQKHKINTEDKTCFSLNLMSDKKPYDCLKYDSLNSPERSSNLGSRACAVNKNQEAINKINNNNNNNRCLLMSNIPQAPASNESNYTTPTISYL